MLYGRLALVGETLTDLQILGCKLHKNVFAGGAQPGPAGAAIIALPRPPSRYNWEGEGGKGTEKGWE